MCAGFRDCAVATNTLHDPVFREKTKKEKKHEFLLRLSFTLVD